MRLTQAARRDGLLAVALVAAGAAALVFRLGQGSLLDFDEATYAEIAREIPVFHDFVRLHFDYTPWLNKAPLEIWLTALVFHFYGTSELTARVVSAAAGAGVVGLTYLLGRTWLSRPAAAGAALALLLINQFVLAARFGTSDILLTFWLYGAILCYVHARGRPHLWLGVGAASGLAFMTKDIASLVGPAAIAVAVLLDGRAAELRSWLPWAGLGLAVVIALPWHAAVYAWQGQAFVQAYFDYMVVHRATAQIEGHVGGVSYYPAWLRRGAYPFSYAAAPAALQHLLTDLRRRQASAVLAAFTLIVLALYTAVRSKLYWYIDPLYPALALVAAGGTAWLLRRRGYAEIATAAVVALAGVWVVPHGLVTIPRTLQLAASVVVLAALGVGLARSISPVPVVAAGILVFAVFGAVTVAPLYSLPQQPAAYLGPLARTHEGAPMLLYVSAESRFPDDNIAHSLIFYSHRDVETVIGLPQLSATVICGSSYDVVLDERDLAPLEQRFDFKRRAGWYRFQLGTLSGRCGE